VVGNVWFVVWQYFVDGHPHCIVLVFGLRPRTFVLCEHFSCAKFIFSFKLICTCDGGDGVVL
jgi:hypothetical protein